MQRVNISKGKHEIPYGFVHTKQICRGDVYYEIYTETASGKQFRFIWMMWENSNDYNGPHELQPYDETS